MKFRRRDPRNHSSSISHYQSYYSINHDGSDKSLKKIRAHQKNESESQAQMQLLNLVTEDLNDLKQTQKGKLGYRLTLKKSTPLNPAVKERIRERNERLIASRQLKKSNLSNNSQSVRGLQQTANCHSLNNANSYQQFLKVPSINEPEIKWVLGLREGSLGMINKKSSSSNSRNIEAPQVFYKETESSKVNPLQFQAHHSVAELPARMNFNSLSHITKNHPNLGTFKFEASLRQSLDKPPKQVLSKQRSFSTIPSFERHEYPKLLTCDSLKKKTLNPEDFKTAFDGHHQYPKYQNLREKNYNVIRQMIKGQNPAKGKIDLPTIGWQSSLRTQYQTERRVSLKKE